MVTGAAVSGCAGGEESFSHVLPLDERHQYMHPWTTDRMHPFCINVKGLPEMVIVEDSESTSVISIIPSADVIDNWH